MRPGLSAACGAATSALVLLGAFVAFKMTRPRAAEAAEFAGPPLRWEVASAARQPARPAPAARPSVRPIAPARAAAPAEVSPTPARIVVADAAFQVRLEPSPDTPRGYAYAHAMRAALARQGVRAARESGKVIWSVDHQFVAQLRDGSRLAVVGGYGVTGVSIRELTPETCTVLFALAEDSGSWLSAPGAGPLRPASAGGLCLQLGPAFEAWRREAPPASPDLADLDRREVSISSPGVFAPRPASRRMAASAGPLFY